MNAARPVPHAVEIPGEVVRPEEVLAEVRLGWMNEDRAVIAVIAVMAATSEGSLLGESSGVAIPSDGSPPEVGLVITRDQSVELASDLWTLQHAGVGINAALSVASLNAIVRCLCGPVMVKPGEAVRKTVDRCDQTAKTVVLMRSPGARPSPTPQIPLLMISSGAVMPPRQLWKPVAPFTGSGAPVRCGVHRVSCSSFETPKPQVFWWRR